MYRIGIDKYFLFNDINDIHIEAISILSDWAIVIAKNIPQMGWFNTFEQAEMLLKILNIKYVFK